MSTEVPTCALVAGGTDGIGFAYLKRACKQQRFTKIYVLGRDFKKVDSWTEERSCVVVNLQCDITDAEALKKHMDSITEPIDVFVNTIGTFYKGLIADTPLDVVQKHFNVNSVANIYFTQLGLPQLNPRFSQIVAVLATLATVPRQTYSIQGATNTK